jgi:hypothetical protein
MNETNRSDGPANAETNGNDSSFIDGQKLLQGFQAASAWLDRHVPAVNALNVFPVPDGDTGTNMSLTMRAALAELNTRTYTSVSDLGHAVAQGALMGARGNSGVILSQILRGFARSMDDKKVLTARGLARALEEGAATAYKGVMKPVEGTILTVVREAAEAAKDAAAMDVDLEQVLERALAEAKASVERTPKLLPVLADAGVVDAGGQGLVLILEGILRGLRGESIEVDVPAEIEEVRHAELADSEYNYDTQFVIQGDDLDLEAIRDEISTMGDSVLVVGDRKTLKVHVHTDYPGQALDYGISQGRVTAVIIENMQEQYEAFKATSGADVSTTPVSTPPPLVSRPAEALGDTCVVAVVSGDGLQRVFESLGAGRVVSGGQTMNPSTQDLVHAIEEMPCDKVIVLPNNSNIILAAQQAKELSSKQVEVVPTRTVPQGIAALLAFSHQADLETNRELMLEASTQVETGEVTRAVRSAQVNGLSIVAGQFIGLLNDDLVTANEDLTAVVMDLLERIDAGEYEIITIYRGQDATPEDAEDLADRVREIYVDIEVEVLDGGQAHYYYILSAE